MPETMQPPAALLQAIRSDLRPVRPLAPPAVRSAVVATVATLAATALLLSIGIRADVAAVPPALLVVHVALRLIFALGLVAIALRDGVPSAAWPRSVTNMVMATAIVLVAALPLQFAAATAASGELAPSHLICLWLIGAAAGPGMIVALWLVARAFPLRPRFAAAAAALGAGMLGEAALFIGCEVSAPGHGLFVHGGGVLALSLLGLAGGSLIARRRFEPRAGLRPA